MHTTKKPRKVVDVNAFKAAVHADRVAHYKKHRSEVGEALLRAALRAVASVDAVSTVNILLEENFGLSDVNLKQQEAEQCIYTVLRAEVTHILATKSDLTPEAQAKMIDRFVARMIPLRDNQPVGMPKAPGQFRTQDLERLIRQDMKKSYPIGAK